MTNEDKKQLVAWLLSVAIAAALGFAVGFGVAP